MSLLSAPLQLFLSYAKEEPELYGDLEAHDLCPASPATSSLLLYHLDHSVHFRTLAPLGPPQGPSWSPSFVFRLPGHSALPTADCLPLSFAFSLTLVLFSFSASTVFQYAA